MDSKPIERVINLKEHEYVSAISDELDEDLIHGIETWKKSIIAVFSPPGTGKTTAICNRAKRFSGYGINTIIVGPTVSLDLKINEELKGAQNFNGEKFEDATKTTVVSTPESLDNALSMYEKNGLYYLAEIDEIHERIDSIDTRPKFANIDKLINSEYCLGVIMHTGTPDAIRDFYDFTKIYTINKKGKKVFNNPKILNVDKMTNQSVKDILEYSYVNFRNTEGQIFAFINDKAKHSYIEENIDLDIFNQNIFDDKSKILYISSLNKDTELVREIIKTKKVPPQYKMIIVTSSVSIGVEFELDNPATVLVFCNNYTFNIRQEIQSTIRVRTNIENLIFVKPSDKNKESSYIEFSKYLNKKLKKYTEILEAKINFWETFKNSDYIQKFGGATKEKFINLMNFGKEEEDYQIEEFCSKALIYNPQEDTFKIDKALLYKYISNEYADMIIKNTKDFEILMRNKCTHFNFSNQEFEILNYNDLFKKDALTEVIKDVLKPMDIDTSKLEKESRKKEREEVIKNEKEKILKHPIGIDNIIDIIQEVNTVASKSLHSNLYSSLENISKIDTTYSALQKLLIVTTKQEDKRNYIYEYLKNDTTTAKLNKYKKEEILKTQMPMIYTLVEKDDLSEIKKQPKAVKEKCYILKYYKKGNDKRYPYRKVTINHDTQLELFKHLQTQGLYNNKEFTDDVEKKIFTSVNELFVLTDSTKSTSKSKSKSFRISSLRY